jgi:hypothetical protein
VTDAGADALERLPPDARHRLDAFARALDRVPIDDLPLYVARVRQPRHRRAVESAELIATQHRLQDQVNAARNALIEGVLRKLVDGQFRVWMGGVQMAPNMGSVDDRVRIAESLRDATTALVLGDRVDAAISAELLGLWDRLLP